MENSPVSIRGLFHYSNRVFGLDEKLRSFADRRRQPDHPLAGVLWSWVLSFWRELPSTEALGRRLQEAPMRMRAGFAEGATPSPDRLGEILEVVQDPDRDWTARPSKSGLRPETAADGLELLLEIFFQAQRSKLLEDSTVAGLRLAAIDLNELFSSDWRRGRQSSLTTATAPEGRLRIHCPKCQQRTKTVRCGDELRQVIEYYHQVVCLQWVGGQIPWPLGWELLGPEEGELTAALRLLDRVRAAAVSELGRSLGRQPV